MDLLERDSDGMYYVDYFYKARGELDDAAYGFPDYIGKLGDIIRRGLMASGHPSKADLRVKFYWMRERYNKMVELVSKPAYVEGLRLDGEDLLADVYKGLRKIGH